MRHYTTASTNRPTDSNAKDNDLRRAAVPHRTAPHGTATQRNTPDPSFF